MPETTRKKLIRVEGLPNGSQPYKVSSMNFAFVSSPADGRRQVCSSMTCREYVNRTVWSALTGNSTSQYTPGHNPPLDTTKLRLLVVYDADHLESFRQKLFNGKAALNLFEAMNKWKPSTITTVKHSYYANAWLLTGPQEWISQPQLLSLATWVMRLASFSGPLNVESYDHLEKSFYDIQKGQSRDSDGDRGSYCREFWNKAYILVKYHKDIFQDMSMKDAWCPSHSDNFGVYSGFLTFCEREASYSNHVRQAQKRFHELCGKHLPRTNPLIARR